MAEHRIHLGLIGDNIAESKAPSLHVLAGQLHGLDVSYKRLVPAQMGMDGLEMLEFCHRHDFLGVNITYPYKQVVAERVEIPDEAVRMLGAVNTVLFEPGGPQGYNTDFSGFVAAYCTRFGLRAPRRACVIGAGGVGSAIGFGLARLGAREIALMDAQPARALALKQALDSAGSGSAVEVFEDVAQAARGADGLLNCTPLGMSGIGGTPLPAQLMRGASWAFDAVYTPENTQFLLDARSNGLATLSGFELFFHQGIHAFRHFTGIDLGAAGFRAQLQDALRESA